MELRELRSFCVAAKVRSITKAANLLGIGQPAVSKHVSTLEREMGQPLFDRVARPINLTPAGVRLLECVEPMIQQLDQLILRDELEPVERLRIAATAIVIQQVLPIVAKRYMTCCEKTRLRILSAATTDDVLELIRSGEADIGVVAHMETWPGLKCETLNEYHRILITPLNHPLLKTGITSINQIAQWPLILTHAGGSTSRDLLAHEFERRRITYDAVVEVNNFTAIKKYVALGLGISVVPSMIMQDEDLELLGTIDLRGFLPTDRFGYVTAQNNWGMLVQRFISILRDSLSEITRHYPTNLRSQ